MNDNTLGIILLLGIIAVALFGGSEAARQDAYNQNQNQTSGETANIQSIQESLRKAERDTEELKAKVQAEVDNKTLSPYRTSVSLSFVSRSSNPSGEYIALRVSPQASANVPISGWIIESQSTGHRATIPSGTYLYFSGAVNSEENIILAPGETAYLITGYSPNGSSFKLNKCSGYLAQFQTYVPYIYPRCPAAWEENLSSIPRRLENDACLDYIGSFPRCKTETSSLPLSWGYECKKFITDTLNYSSCVSLHKSDANFYSPEWRIYLKRSSTLWKNRRETIILKDLEGKVVSTLTY